MDLLSLFFVNLNHLQLLFVLDVIFELLQRFFCFSLAPDVFLVILEVEFEALLLVPVLICLEGMILLEVFELFLVLLFQLGNSEIVGLHFLLE